MEEDPIIHTITYNSDYQRENRNDLVIKYQNMYKQHHPDANYLVFDKRIKEANPDIKNWAKIQLGQKVNIPMDIPKREVLEQLVLAPSPVTAVTPVETVSTNQASEAVTTTTEATPVIEEEPAVAEASSKPSKAGVYPVCQGAECMCDKSVEQAPNGVFEVKTQSTIYINDKDGADKLLASTKDLPLPFVTKSKTFGSCKMQPTITSYLPCIPNIVQWEKSYESITLPNEGTALIQESEGICSFGGKIAFVTHGQTQTVSQVDLEATSPEIAALLNPALSEEIVEKLLAGEFNDTDENSIGIKDIVTTDNESPVKHAYTYHTGHSSIEFKVSKSNPQTMTEAQKAAVNWVVYRKKGNIYEELYTFVDKGSTFTFPYRTTGIYAVEAYGKSKTFNLERGNGGAYNLVHIKHQELRHSLKLLVGNQDRTQIKRVRPTEIITLSAGMLFPDTTPLKPRHILWEVTSGGEDLEFTKHATLPQISIAAQNNTKTKTIYVKASCNGVSTESFKFYIGNNYVKAIKSDKETICILNKGETEKERHKVTYSVATYAIEPATEAEKAQVKWIAYHNTPKIENEIGTGHSLTKTSEKEGQWYVEAYVKEPGGVGKATTKPLKAIISKITKAYWADKDGNSITKSGYKHQVYIHIETQGLQGEKLQLKVWESQKGKDKWVENAGTAIEIKDSNGIVNQAFTIPEDKAGLSENYKYEFFFTIEKLDFTVQGTQKDAQAGNQYILVPDGKVRYLDVDSKKKITSLKIYETGNKLHTGIIKYGDTVTIKVSSRNLINEDLEFLIYEDFWLIGADQDQKETIKLKIDNQGNAETTFTIPCTWEKKHEVGKEGIPRNFYLKEKNSGEEFPRAYYVANPNKTEEENKKNSQRIRALMLKVAKELPKNETAIDTNNAVVLGEELTGGVDGDCKGRYCIRQGAESKLIQEINIRLAGFGGNVPTKKFTVRTVAMVKQFQKDYMGIEPTGNICGSTLKAIDEFEAQYPINFDEIKCKCGKCDGFGSGKFIEHKQNNSISEKFRKYEYPGIHRSLIWSYKALMFYTSVNKKEYNFTIKCIYSGYRCHEDNKQKNPIRKSTNHMGKAIDIHFYKNGIRNNVKVSDMEQVRDKVIIPTNKAQIRWTGKNLFSIEPSRKIYPKEFIATTWIHMDVRRFELDFLKDEFFVDTLVGINGEKIVDLAKSEGCIETCKCLSSHKSAKETEITACSICKSLEKRRIDFYNQVGEPSINYVSSISSSNKFKGLYMVAQRRQENGFHLVTPGNNPMNIKGKGDAGQIELTTHEYINDKKISMKDGFAKFTTMEKGFEGYSNLLQKNFKDAYLSLKEESKTIDDFLLGLQDKGRIGSYATDPNYKFNIKSIFKGVVNDYKKWLKCKLSCTSFDKKTIEEDLKLIEKLK